MPLLLGRRPRHEELDKPPALAARGGYWFRGGNLEIHLGVEEPFAPARKAHPGLRVDGLQRLEQAGYSVTWDGEFHGHDRFYSADPCGTGSSSCSNGTTNGA